MQSDQGKRAKKQIVSPPLGWSLSKLSRDWMDTSLADPEKKVFASATGAPKRAQAPQEPKNCYQRNAEVLEELSKHYAR